MNAPKIYFDEELHKYTDELGNTYTSVTTVLGKYEEKFKTLEVARACEKIGKNPRHPKYFKYRNKSAKQIVAEWDALTEVALDNGNEKHNFLEDAVKTANGYNLVNKKDKKFINGRIYTINDILTNHTYGEVDLDYFIKTGIKERYPKIFKLLATLVKGGYRLYAEIGVYSIDLLISGLIDILAVKEDKFIIVDWKTNKSPIRFEAGYYEKDNEGNITDNYILTDKKLLFPVHFLPASTLVKYSLQLSGYAYLVSRFGLTLEGILLCHIRTVNDREVIEILPIKFYKNEIDLIFNHHYNNLDLKSQSKFQFI
jgi:hypothetical protein